MRSSGWHPLRSAAISESTPADGAGPEAASAGRVPAATRYATPMYGLINKAVEGLVRSRFGDAAWDRIRARAGLPDEPFVGMEQYPDKTTYDLVGAASAELGAPAESMQGICFLATCHGSSSRAPTRRSTKERSMACSAMLPAE